MKDCYFLYIDILGFRDMALDKPSRVDALLEVIDKLHAHRHPNFKVIAFSDTILVYSTDDPRGTDEPGGLDDHRYLVMYSIEFAMDLHERLVGSGIYFRAILSWDEFCYREMDHIQSYYGPALIRSYEFEKGIPCTGLFIDSSLRRHNEHYPSTRFNDQYDFVFLAHGVDLRLHFGFDIEWPLNSGTELLWDTDLAWGFESGVAYLHDLHSLMRGTSDPRIRTKALATWDFYASRYPKMCAILEQTEFNLHALADGVDWERIQESRIRDLVSRGLAKGNEQ